MPVVWQRQNFNCAVQADATVAIRADDFLAQTNMPAHPSINGNRQDEVTDLLKSDGNIGATQAAQYVLETIAGARDVFKAGLAIRPVAAMYVSLGLVGHGVVNQQANHRTIGDAIVERRAQ